MMEKSNNSGGQNPCITLLRVRKVAAIHVRQLAAILLISLLIITGAYAANLENAPAPLIKAAYLYKFIFFTQWPDMSSTGDVSADTGQDKFIIGILGEDKFGKHFQPIEGRTIASLNRTITVKRFGRYKPGLNLKQCHMLFICASEKSALPEILKTTGSASILTVADAKDFAEKGVMINLITVNDRIRWELNLTAIKKSGLNVSSTLIQSAVNVFSAP